MKNRKMMELFGLFLILFLYPSKSQAKTVNAEGTVNTALNRPNVLFIVVDDLVPAVITSYGGPVLTPNIDQLASQAIRFTNAYSQQALCAPSRVSFLTGRRPDTTKTYFNNALYWRLAAGNFTTIPQFFKESGYFTASVGKVFHGGPVSGNLSDFEYSWSVLPYHPPSLKYSYKQVCPGDDGKLHFNLLCPVNVTSQPTGSLPDIQSTDHILEIFQNLSKAGENGRSHSQDTPVPHLPFFLGMGLYKPHISFRYPEQYLDLYPLESVEIAPNAFYSKTQPPVAWNPWQDIKLREDIARLNVPFPYGPLSRKYHRLIRQAYYASATYMDYELGRVLEGLEKAGFADNTIISFVSDHGWQLGEHQEWCKYSNYATSTRVPFMIHIPNMTEKNKDDRTPKFPLRDPFVKRNRSFVTSKSKGSSVRLQNHSFSNALVELTDIFPTLVDLAGLPKPPLCPVNSSNVNLCVEGVSLVPLIQNKLKGKDRTWKKAAFTQYPRPSDKPQLDSDQPTLANTTIMGYSMITADRYHYTEWVAFNNDTCSPIWSNVHARELYVLEEDPLEDDNVADKPRYETLVQKLSQELRKGWRHALPT